MSDQTQGTAAPEAVQNDASGVVTEAQLNKAITARLAAFEKKQSQQLTDGFSAFEKKLSELVTPKTPEGATPQADATKSILDHPEVKGMAKKLLELEQRAKSAEEKALAEEARGRDSTLRTKLVDALQAAGIKDPIRAKHAVSFIVDGAKLVRWTDDNSALVFKDAEQGEMDFATGLKGWLKSDDAKLYLPAPDARTPDIRTTRSNGAPPASLNADSSFEDKLSATASQLSRAGVPVT